MSRAEFEKARNRLRQAKSDILWALEALHDKAALKDYKLTGSEKERLLLALREDLTEIHNALAQVPSNRETIRVERIVETIIDDSSSWKDTTTEPTEDADEGSYTHRQSLHIT